MSDPLEGPLDHYLVELRVYLDGIVPGKDMDRFLEETADHLFSVTEEGVSEAQAIADFGDARRVADHVIEGWYTHSPRLGVLERKIGPGNARVLVLFGASYLAYWAVLQTRLYLPATAAIRLPWSPAEMRRYFPEPLPFPDFSIGFLLLIGIPILCPPILGWRVGRMIPIRPHAHVYGVLTPLILFSYTIGVALLPFTDGLVFSVIQLVYGLPVATGAAYLAYVSDRAARRARAARSMA
ncbi:hypothetical protein EON81_18830 [bacterium]|nr:MAG: hypothetical protein EON81_18830 [bacterium]